MFSEVFLGEDVCGVEDRVRRYHAIGAPWYMSNVEIHEDLGVPFFVEHIRALTKSYDSKLAGVGNPLVQQLGRYLR